MPMAVLGTGVAAQVTVARLVVVRAVWWQWRSHQLNPPRWKWN